MNLKECIIKDDHCSVKHVAIKHVLRGESLHLFNAKWLNRTIYSEADGKAFEALACVWGKYCCFKVRHRQRWCTQVMILMFRAIKVKNIHKKEDWDLSVMLITREKHHTFVTVIKAVTANRDWGKSIGPE